MTGEALATVSQRYVLQKQVVGLSICCPFDQTNPCACPLYAVRKMGVMERFEWLHEQSEEDMLNVLAHHQKCLGNKRGS